MNLFFSCLSLQVVANHVLHARALPSNYLILDIMNSIKEEEGYSERDGSDC